ncbi:MAG: hypothetical protein M5U12_05115 [Verrucomicrobia bacterium]|nr:hypothetical protein [Verrucomicrobiota bacterium]
MAREQDQSSGANPTAAHFATTHWSLVFAAGRGGSSEAREAMADLCRIYWYPSTPTPGARRHRRCGAGPDPGFFAHLLAHDLVASADAARGRFRSFLLRCLQNFAASEHARATRVKRGGDDRCLAGCAGGRAAIRP